VILSSWKNNDDPSQCPYAFEVDAKGIELVVRHNSILKCQSGSWNGVGFGGVLSLNSNSLL